MTKRERRFSPIRHIPRYSALFFRALRTPLLVFFVLAGNLLTFLCAAVFTALERGHNPKVHGFFDGLWWAFTTVTTVGYGDISPVTFGGRVAAVLLMLTGITFFVGFAAVLVSAIDTLAAEEATEDSTDLVIRELHAEMKELRKELRELRGALLK